MQLSRRSAIAVAAVALAGIGASATAQAQFSDCDPNRSCLWGNNDYI